MISMKKQAKKLAKKGRRGDSHLLHISREELMGLMGTGRVTRNPDTGLPEAFGLPDWASNPVGYVTSHAPSWAPPAAPGSLQSFGDAIQLNKWGGLFGPNENSFDAFAGGASARNPMARDVGRAVGTIALGETAFGAATPTDSATPSPEDVPAGDTPVDAGGSSGGDSPPNVEPQSDFPSSPSLSGFDPGGGEGGGFPGETTTGGDAVPGDAGGPGTGAGDMDWASRLKQFGQYLPSLKQAGNALQIGGGAYGLYNAYQGRQAQKAQQKQQQAYYDQLNALMANPGQVQNLPGYKFNLNQGSEALARRMASMGYGTSGNLALATQQFGSDYSMAALGQQEQLLASQYGRAQPPTRLMPDPTTMAFDSLRNMGYGFQGG